MAAGVAQGPVDQLRVAQAVADHPDAPVLVEDEVGRGRQDLLLRDDRPGRRAEPALDLGPLLGREGVVGQVVGPRGGAPPVPSPPLGLGLDVELLVVGHLVARLPHEALARRLRAYFGLAGQGVGERRLDRRAVLFRLRP